MFLRSVPVLVLFLGCMPAEERLTLVADRPITVLASGGAVVTLTATPSGFSPAAVTWSQVTDRINPRRAGSAAVLNGSGLQATATCSVPGIYQFRATASGPSGAVVATTWVQVWDSAGAVSPTAPVATGPAMTPPPSVRTLSATPGAFVHPRILFTDADWPEISARAASGRIAKWGTDSLRTLVTGNLDTPSTKVGTLAAGLDAYAQGTGSIPDLSALAGDGILASESAEFASVLFAAAYLQWLDSDPAVAPGARPLAVQNRGRQLARILAAAATLRLSAVWNRSAGTLVSPVNPASLAITGIGTAGEGISATGLCDLAMAYDLLYGWMDDPQRTAVRELLVAAGYARHQAGAGFETQGANIGRPRLGSSQNGDFSNMNDQHLLLDLAVEGEISAVGADVIATFCTPAAGKPALQWVKAADPATDAAAWPLASVGAVDGLERQVRWLVDWNTSPWGFIGSHLAYWGLTCRYMFPTTLAYARRGENLFVTTHLYQIAFHALAVLHPAEAPINSRIKIGSTPLASSSLGWWDHHDSGGYGQRGTAAIIAKYMYPDDPLVDYVYRAYLPGLDRDPFLASAFGLDPGVGIPAQTLTDVAAAKKLPLSIYDPQRGIVSLRSAWDDQGVSVWFENNGSDPYAGHMHAEKNSFDLYALGRAWSIAPGYHVTISDAQAAVLVKDPRYAGDAATGGFIGESPSSATQVAPLPGNFPTPPGRMLALENAPGGEWTLVAGDATVPYTYGFSGARNIDTGMRRSSFLPAGLFQDLTARSPDFASVFNANLMVSQVDYNPMEYAIRSLLLVRGSRPYVVVIDDIRKNGAAQDWRWTMNSGQGFGAGIDTRFINAKGQGVYASTVIQAGATATEAVLAHSPIDDGGGPGLPRLLVRELGAGSPADHPAIALVANPPGGTGGNYLTYGVDNNHPADGPVQIPSCRLLIERRNLASPGYTVLLFPHRTGEALPVTTWNADRTRLRIDLGGGTIHTLFFDRTQADHRTRVAWLAGDPPPGVPVLTSATTATGTVGTPFAFTVTSTEPSATYTFTPVPGGLSFQPATGVLSGTPTGAGITVATVTATTTGGSTSGTVTLTIQAAAGAVAPTITSPGSASAVVGAAFTYVVTADQPGAVFSVTGLPAGLTFTAATGTISGTPTMAGTANIALSAKTAAGTGTKTLVLGITAPGTDPGAGTGGGGGGGGGGCGAGSGISALLGAWLAWTWRNQRRREQVR